MKVYPPLPSARRVCKEPLKTFSEQQLAILDPKSSRTRLFNKRNPDGAKVGDILLVRFRSGDPFAGVCMNIRKRGVDTGILLRSQLTRIGTELWVKVYSPTVTGIEVVQKAAKRARRARLYYLRYDFWIFVKIWHGLHSLLLGLSSDQSLDEALERRALYLFIEHC